MASYVKEVLQFTDLERRALEVLKDSLISDDLTACVEVVRELAYSKWVNDRRVAESILSVFSKLCRPIAELRKQLAAAKGYEQRWCALESINDPNNDEDSYSILRACLVDRSKWRAGSRT